MRYVVLVIALAACEVHGGQPAATTSGSFTDDTDLGWSEMQRVLVGKWRAETNEKRVIEVSYRVVSKGSALVETFTSASGKETITVYHRDGRALMLTHYCAQGNQARLKATQASRERVDFSFLDATNLAADQDVMRRLSFVFRDDGFDQEMVYRDPRGTESKAILHFERAP
jgi:hypothetical protein